MCCVEVEAIACTTDNFTQDETTYVETDTMAVPTMSDAETSARVAQSDKYTHCMVPLTSSETMTENQDTSSVSVQCSLIVEPQT